MNLDFASLQFENLYAITHKNIAIFKGKIIILYVQILITNSFVCEAKAWDIRFLVLKVPLQTFAYWS